MTGPLTFSLAGPGDEAQLRELLRGQPLPGWVTLGFEREPDFFAAARLEGERHRVLLAREGANGPLAGFCSRVSRRVFIGGEPSWLGYLGQFRTAGGWQGGPRAYRLLRQGFAEVRRRLCDPDELPWDITSILAGNRPARRILSADLPKLPRYRRISGFTTLVYRSGGRRRSADAESGASVGLGAIADCLQRNYRRYRFAPVWDEAALRAAGLESSDFLVLREGGRVTACLGLWDQRPVKQTVVRAYRAPLGRLRPLFNLLAPLGGLPALPPVGSSLSQAFLSHLACDRDDPTAAAELLREGLALAGRRGIEQLTLGLAEGHPLLATARALRRHLDYRSDIYTVHWPDASEEGPKAMDQGPPLHLEVASL